jgi:cytochrome P450
LASQFYQTLDEILFTNVEITFSALAWTLYLVARHEGVQRKLFSEIDGASSSGGPQGYAVRNGV